MPWNLNPLHQNMFTKFGWNWSLGSGVEDENVKVYDDDNNDYYKDRPTNFEKSSCEPLAQVS